MTIFKSWQRRLGLAIAALTLSLGVGAGVVPTPVPSLAPTHAHAAAATIGFWHWFGPPGSRNPLIGCYNAWPCLTGWSNYSEGAAFQSSVYNNSPDPSPYGAPVAYTYTSALYSRWWDPSGYNVVVWRASFTGSGVYCGPYIVNNSLAGCAMSWYLGPNNNVYDSPNIILLNDSGMGNVSFRGHESVYAHELGHSTGFNHNTLSTCSVMYGGPLGACLQGGPDFGQYPLRLTSTEWSNLVNAYSVNDPYYGYFTHTNPNWYVNQPIGYGLTTTQGANANSGGGKILNPKDIHFTYDAKPGPGGKLVKGTKAGRLRSENIMRRMILSTIDPVHYPKVTLP